VSSSARVERELVEQMCAVLRHRGPDSQGVHVEGNVGLGIQRLAVIDLRTGDQPIENEDGSVVVVLNGEIYNYRELRTELLEAGHVLTSQSDTEVIVHLYEDLGVACVERLRGMFAFALWDARRRRLLLARDRIGKKPLYYAQRGGDLWFGSEAKAILQDPALPRTADLAGIDSFLQFQYVPHERCAFEGLTKVPPAHLLTFENGRVQLSRYWKLSYAHQLTASDDELIELIREELLEATRLRLRSDVPLGIFLSGGVDSSAVLAAAAQHSSDRLQTFTIGFATQQFDERPHAAEIARLFDTDHTEVVVEPDIVEILPSLAWHYSEPFADQSAVPSFYVSELARRHVTVALSGDGGDESFGGYRRYRGNDVSQKLAFIPSALGNAAIAALTRSGLGGAQDSSRARMVRLLRGAQLDESSRYLMWMSCFGEADKDELYTESAWAAIRDRRADVPAPIRDAMSASDASSLVERLLDVDTQTYLTDQLLVKMDVASMAYSLEVRSPLLDHRFMELAAKLPLSAKLGKRTTKRLLKRALSPWIPMELLERPKQGFTMPIGRWLRVELSDLPNELLLDGRTEQRGLFEPTIIRRLIADHRSGIADNSNKLWALVQLELWFRTYVDIRPSGPIDLELRLPSLRATSVVG
jgi:asparagine synthase (glutamine-hydrolysing)